MFGAATPKAYDRFIVEPVIKETFGMGGGTCHLFVLLLVLSCTMYKLLILYSSYIYFFSL